jgi:hypothetical protein
MPVVRTAAGADAAWWRYAAVAAAAVLSGLLGTLVARGVDHGLWGAAADLSTHVGWLRLGLGIGVAGGVGVCAVLVGTRAAMRSSPGWVLAGLIGLLGLAMAALALVTALAQPGGPHWNGVGGAVGGAVVASAGWAMRRLGPRASDSPRR